jgi:uncharacterized protein YidB (DUF937 family)
MDDLSKLISGMESAGASDGSAGQIAGLAQAIQSEGGLDAIVGKLRAGGLGDAVDSWVSTGGNKVVDPNRLGEALGPDTVQKLSASSGLSIASLLPMLAAFLPQIVNMLTPDGQLPSGGLNDAASSVLPQIGQVLGSLTGGSSGSGSELGGLLGGLDDLLGGKKGG